MSKTAERIDPRLVETDRRAKVEEKLFGILDWLGVGCNALMVSRLTDEVEALAREGWLPVSEWVPNDLEAAGECCCNGCIGVGPCDLGDPYDPADADERAENYAERIAEMTQEERDSYGR